jgi:hypothetical protein
MATHAQLPVADAIDGDRLRIYFATRDRENRSSITFLEADAEDPARVLYVHDRPVLSCGPPGCFDDRGALPSCLVAHAGTKYLYYIGVNAGVTVPYHYSIGLATSPDGLGFTRAHPGPVLDRMHAEPHLCTAPWVRLDAGVWRMWYTAGLGWEVVEGRPEPLYHIRYTESSDGVSWRRPGRVCLDLCGAEAGLGRPGILFADGRYRMWFSARGNRGYRLRGAASYRIGYAESHDGIEWARHDAGAGIATSAEGWDSDMIEYPCVFARGLKRYMFYNGNGFGRSGFGYAVAGWAETE